jgi:hypothetical protein
VSWERGPSAPELPLALQELFILIRLQRVLDIYELENSSGIVVSVGGQLPQLIALRLQETGGASKYFIYTSNIPYKKEY